MQMPGRKFTASSSSYRYGFNGKENDKDAGEGIQDYGMRIYNSRLGRFLSVDPLTKDYPELTPYQFASNRPIDGIDEDGLEYKPAGRYGPRQTAIDGVATSNKYNMSPAQLHYTNAQIKLANVVYEAQKSYLTAVARHPVFKQTPKGEPSQSTINARREHGMDAQTGEKTKIGKLFESKTYEKFNENIVEPIAIAALAEIGGNSLIRGGAFFWKSVTTKSVIDYGVDLAVLQSMNPSRSAVPYIISYATDGATGAMGVNGKLAVGSLASNLKLPIASLTKTPLMQCAEPKAFNLLLSSGANQESLYFSSYLIKPGPTYKLGSLTFRAAGKISPKAPCTNCLVTTQGATPLF